MKKIRMALIGAGDMANKYHYSSLSSFEDVELVGLCDLAEDRLNATADRFGIPKRFRLGSNHRLKNRFGWRFHLRHRLRILCRLCGRGDFLLFDNPG